MFKGQLRWLGDDACHTNQDNRDKCAQYATTLATALGAAPLMPLLRDACLDNLCSGTGNLPPIPPIAQLFPWGKVAPETLAMQRALNTRLAEDGLCAIPENGVLDGETCGAAKHYGATVPTCQAYTAPAACPNTPPNQPPKTPPVPPPVPPPATAPPTPVKTSSTGLVIGGIMALVGVAFVAATVAGGGAARGARLDNARRPVRRIGTFGDVNPVDYGGGVIYRTEYGVVAEYVHGLDGGDTEERMTLYSVDVPTDVFADHTWADVDAIATTIGADPDELRAAGKSRKIQERVYALEAIAGHYGWHELDNYPDTLTAAEVRRRWRAY